MWSSVRIGLFRRWLHDAETSNATGRMGHARAISVGSGPSRLDVVPGGRSCESCRASISGSFDSLVAQSMPRRMPRDAIRQILERRAGSVALAPNAQQK